MAGATDMTIEMLPMVLPRDSGGTSVITVVISSGIMIAVPVAWMTRPTTSSSRPGETAQISVPRLKIDMASMKIGRVLITCSKKPVTGMTTAMVKQERRGEPLRRAGADAEIGHEVRNGDAHDGFVEKHHEGRNEQQRDDEAIARSD